MVRPGLTERPLEIFGIVSDMAADSQGRGYAFRRKEPPPVSLLQRPGASLCRRG